MDLGPGLVQGCSPGLAGFLGAPQAVPVCMLSPHHGNSMAPHSLLSSIQVGILASARSFHLSGPPLSGGNLRDVPPFAPALQSLTAGATFNNIPNILPLNLISRV